MITMLLSLPRWVYAVIAALVLLISTYFYGHHKGWYQRDAEMQAEIARLNEQSREIERAMSAKLNTTATQLQEANHAVNEKSSALDRAIRAGRVRLPTASCVQTPATAPAPAGDRNQTGGQPDRQTDEVADSDRETLAAIAAIVAEGDRAINQLNACIDAYNQVKDSINGQR